eukprot:5051-Pyramimonas_sp.AAC.1
MVPLGRVARRRVRTHPRCVSDGRHARALTPLPAAAGGAHSAGVGATGALVTAPIRVGASGVFYGLLAFRDDRNWYGKN